MNGKRGGESRERGNERRESEREVRGSGEIWEGKNIGESSSPEKRG